MLLFAAALAFLIFVICGYLFGWKWTGLPNQTLWDWLSLLIVPIVLAIGGAWFTARRKTWDQEIAEMHSQKADQRVQDGILQAYLDQIGYLLLDENKPLRQSEQGDEGASMARARTRAALAGFDGVHKRRVLEFLYEARLIGKDHVVVDLSGTDLSGANLSNANLSDALELTDLGYRLRAAASLEGATMPDGQTLRSDKMPHGPTFEDWLKDKKTREEGE